MATLRAGGGSSDGSAFCILCGAQREIADLISNILLFAPFGVAIAVRRATFWRALLVGLTFSGLIELAQVDLVPGRDANLRDVLANTLGTLLGWIMWRSRPWRVARHFGIAHAAGVTALLCAALVAGLSLFTPVILAPRYRMYWTPDWDNHELYRGHVLSSGLGGIRVQEPAVWLEPGEEVRHLLRQQPLHIRFIAGPPTEGISPILSIHSAGIEFVMIGVLGGDLIYRYWARSDEARLDHANLQLADRLTPFEPGDTVSLTFHFAEAGYCLELNGVRECRRGFAVGDTWTLLTSPDWPRGRMAVAGVLWLWGLFLVCGFVARDRRVLLTVTAVTIALLLAGPRLVGFPPTPLHQIAAAIAGVLTGYIVAGAFPRRERPVPDVILHEPGGTVAGPAS